MSPHSSPRLRAAEELELQSDGSSLGENDEFQDLPISPSGPSTSTSPSKSSATGSPEKPTTSTPIAKGTPSKVRAAAAMFEQSTTSTSTNTTPVKAGKDSNSPGSTFRSIPASSIRTSPQKRSPENLPNGTTGSSPDLKQPPKIQLASPPQIGTEERGNEGFADIPLSAGRQTSTAPAVSISESASYSLSPIPPPADIYINLPDPVVTPPAKEEPKKTGFFSSALGFGTSPAGSSTVTPVTSTPASRSVSTSSHANPIPNASAGAGAGTGWRSTMSNLFVSRSSSATSPPLGGTASPAEMTPTTSTTNGTPGPSRQQSATSAAFILNRMSSTTASRDRRISKELGGGDKLREGFERVRNEMEGAAREMRRERQVTAESTVASATSSDHDGVSDDSAIDWAFWGAVVQDYEAVAVSQPKELSKAIQHGIPPVIRGAIWQLMSSSKDASLEESYKALLKIPSPHEKAIQKDINRTFPHHKHFQEGGGAGQEGLFMVVKAYSLYDQEVGYTQGLAFIVAALLLNMPDEEAFCVLVRLMDSYNLRSHYLADMPGLQLRLFQLDRLLEETIPLLHTHFVRKGVKSSMWASQWFMTLFSYRFPLSLVYRVLDIVFAEGLEAMFRFSLALLQRSEDKLLGMEFEQILNYLQSDLFEIYRLEPQSESDQPEREREEPIASDEGEWKANEFVRDAYEIRITPFMLDAYEAEYEEQRRDKEKHAHELDQLRNANRSLSTQVKQLEASLAAINQEHVELVRELVMSKIEKEETANELVRVKLQYAELAHAQQDAMSVHSRSSTSLSSRHPR